MPITNRSVLRSTVLLFMVGLAALAAIVVTTLWLMVRTSDYADAVIDVRGIRSAIVDLRSLVQDAETGQRGFLLTSKENYLAPLTRAKSEIPSRIGKLRKQASAFPDMQAPIDGLSQLVAQKIEELDRTISLAKAGDRDQALAIVDTDAGKVLMDNIREKFDALVADADQRFSENVAKQRSNATALQWVSVVGAAIILLVVGAAAWTVVRYTRELSDARSEIEILNVGLEEKVRERTSELGRANEEIQRFAYIVTHDLRAPLVNIMGFTSELETSLAPIQALLATVEPDGNEQVVREATTSVTEDLPEAIGFIRSSTRKMDGLINAILKLSREGQRRLNPEKIELRPFFQAAADAIQHQISEAAGEISLDVAVPVITSDRLSLERAIGNLFDNAVKYAEPSRPLRIAVRSEATFANRILIEIEDNGRGIADQDHERIFELFRRSGQQDKQGEGIGLAHVRSSIRSLGGDITLSSKLGHGTTFKINLPRDLAVKTRRSAA